METVSCHLNVSRKKRPKFPEGCTVRIGKKKQQWLTGNMELDFELTQEVLGV